ncbi:hypothetical protein CFP56_005434 [Quercus suber]|uniref:Uncharacterized protein n=1 Tax=Quercus suber TaxID=58331 RepID=A0AAW0LAA8_QUESU
MQLELYVPSILLYNFLLINSSLIGRTANGAVEESATKPFKRMFPSTSLSSPAHHIPLYLNRMFSNYKE